MKELKRRPGSREADDIGQEDIARIVGVVDQLPNERVNVHRERGRHCVRARHCGVVKGWDE